MGLIEQFCAASKEWAIRTGQSETAIVFYTMFRTGGWRHFDTVGRVEKDSLSEERQRQLTLGEVLGHHTPEQMETWLTRLVTQIGLDEEFLIVSIIHWIDAEFERISEDYAKGVRTRREMLEWLERIAGDPNLKEEWLNHRTSWENSNPPTDDELSDMVVHMRKQATPSLEEQRQNRVALDVWHEVAEPILDVSNLKEFRDKLFLENWKAFKKRDNL